MLRMLAKQIVRARSNILYIHMVQPSGSFFFFGGGLAYIYIYIKQYYKQFDLFVPKLDHSILFWSGCFA